MPHIKIDRDRCKGCMLCVMVCPVGLIRKSKKLNKGGAYCVEVAGIKEKTCTGCAMCALMCPDVCIEVWR